MAIVAIYGGTGVGKTTLALSSDKCVLLDFDLGSQRTPLKMRAGDLAYSDDKVVYTIRTYQDFEKLQQELKKEKGIFSPFSTIIVDTLNKFQSLIEEELVATARKLNPARSIKTLSDVGAYGKGIAELNAICKIFEKMLMLTGKHIVYLAQAKEEEKKELKDKSEQITIVRPDISGSFNKNFFDSCDFVGYLTKNKKGERIINLTSSPDIIKSKGEELFFQDGVREDIIIPNGVNEFKNFETEAPCWFQKRIIDVIVDKGKLEEQIVLQASKQAIDFQNKINLINTQDELDELYVEWLNTKWFLANKMRTQLAMKTLVIAKKLISPKISLEEKEKKEAEAKEASISPPVASSEQKKEAKKEDVKQAKAPQQAETEKPLVETVSTNAQSKED